MIMEISILEKTITELKKKYTNEYGLNKDGYKGALIELIATKLLEKLGYKVTPYRNKNDNMTKGDLLIISRTLKPYKGEVKSSHIWSCTDKQAIDVKYTEIYQRDSEGNFIKRGDRKILLPKELRGKIPYNQNESTGNDIGWGYIFNSDWLISVNLEHKKAYIIYEGKKLLEQVMDITDLYINMLGYDQWYKNDYKNYIHDYIEGSIKRDSCKESYIINLELSPESLDYFNVKYDIIDFNVNLVKRERKKRLP